MENNQEINLMRRIKTNMFAVMAMSVAFLSVNVVALADSGDLTMSENDSIGTIGLHDRFANMTEAEFNTYNDSVYASLYPEAYLCKADSSSFANMQDENPVNAIANVTSHVPESVEIDKSKAVGEIVIKSGANQFGAKTYEVPIEMYPGMNGMTPEISLSYNSLGGNSFLGMGWSISGIPSINREPCSLYYSHETEPVTLTLADLFSLDGLKLLPRGIEYI